MGWGAKDTQRNTWKPGLQAPERSSPVPGRPGGAVGDLYSAVHAGMLQILLNIEMSILVS